MAKTPSKSYYLRLLEQLHSTMSLSEPFEGSEDDSEHWLFLMNIHKLLDPQMDVDLRYEQGANLLCRIFAAYPHISPLVPRDLLWFFGGDCLHFLTDEEIAGYQRLDELLAEADPDTDVDRDLLKRQAFRLH